VTDLVDGPSLRAVLAGGALDWTRARRMILQMTDAAGALHRQAACSPASIPIRSASPARPAPNISCSRAAASAPSPTCWRRCARPLRGVESSELELPYLAPEVLTGRPPDARADLFTIGVVAYQLVAGRLPFQAPTLPELIGTMFAGAPPAIAGAGVPATAAAAIARCLAADPAARGTLAELQVAVRQAAA
jgi:serine/threonine-protein kinase